MFSVDPVMGLKISLQNTLNAIPKNVSGSQPRLDVTSARTTKLRSSLRASTN
jgi:hypothetical protein